LRNLSGRRGLSGGGTASNVAKNITTMGSVSKAQKKAASNAAVKSTQNAYKEAVKNASKGSKKYDTVEDVRRKLDDPNHVWKF